jgi:hypothetical protein
MVEYAHEMFSLSLNESLQYLFCKKVTVKISFGWNLFHLTWENKLSNNY